MTDHDHIDLDINMTGHSFEYIEMVYEGLSSSGKTGIWSIRMKRDRQVELGQIRWMGRWRQYAFYPNMETIYSRGCLDDVAAFMVAIEQAREKRLAGAR